MVLLAGQVRSRNIVSICEGDTRLQGAQILGDRNVAGAPVVDGDHAVCGIIRTTDILTWIERDGIEP